MNNATKLFEKFKNFREDIIFDLTKITKKHNNLINLDSSKEFEYVGEESNVFNVRYLKLIINSHGNLCVEMESSLIDEGHYEEDIECFSCDELFDIINSLPEEIKLEEF